MYFFVGLKKFAGFLYNLLGMGVKYLVILIKKLFLGIEVIITFLYKQGINLLKFFGRLGYFLVFGIKEFGMLLYKIITYPFIYLYNNLSDIIHSIANKISKFLIRMGKFITSIPLTLKNKAFDWYNNLSFVKDRRNKREMKRQTLLIDFENEEAVRSEKKMLYNYVAENSEGKLEKGKIKSYSKLDVHSYLLSEGYNVYEINVSTGINFNPHGSYKMKGNDLVFFLAQLSTYIKAGISLVDSIKILSKQSRKIQIKDLYRSVIYELTMGENFSESLAKQEESFPKLLVNMIKAAEMAGSLAETLDNMADYYTAINKTKKQMVSAMMYPIVIFGFAILIIAFILIYVIPEFIGIYEGMGGEIPAITTITINASSYLSNNYIYIIIGIILIIGFVLFLYKNLKFFKVLVQWSLMHMPVIGKIIIYNEVTMFSKTFGSLLKHNVFITESMEILSKITNNEIYKMLIFDTITNLARGEPISKSFKNNWAFPIVAYEMLLTGERTGQPGPMMEKVADYYQDEHNNAVNQVKVFIEPVMIVFLAVVVGFILLSVILPMFSLYGDLGA